LFIFNLSDDFTQKYQRIKISKLATSDVKFWNYGKTEQRKSTLHSLQQSGQNKKIHFERLVDV
jgi:hypothetical protein